MGARVFPEGSKRAWGGYCYRHTFSRTPASRAGTSGRLPKPAVKLLSILLVMEDVCNCVRLNPFRIYYLQLVYDWPVVDAFK